MRKFVRSMQMVAALLVGFLPVTAAAQAVDAQKVAAQLIMHAGHSGVAIEIGQSETDGRDVILRAVEVGEDDDATKFAEVRLHNVTALPRGAFMIGRVVVPADKQPGPLGNVSTGAMTLTNILVPALDDKTTPALYTERFEMEPSQVTSTTGQVIAEVGRIRWSAAPYAPGRELTSTLEPVTIAFDKANTAAVAGFITGPKVKLEIGGNGSWRDSDGRTTFATTLSIAELGKITFDVGITGLKYELLHELGKAAYNSDATGGNPAAALAGLAGFATDLKFEHLNLRFDDASLTRKALDEAAKKSGQARADYATQLKAMAPMLLAFVNDPKLTQQTTAALSTYLDNPKSLAIGIKAKSSTSLMDLGLKAMMAPQSMTRHLNVQVTANR